MRANNSYLRVDLVLGGLTLELVLGRARLEGDGLDLRAADGDEVGQDGGGGSCGGAVGGQVVRELWGGMGQAEEGRGQSEQL